MAGYMAPDTRAEPVREERLAGLLVPLTETPPEKSPIGGEKPQEMQSGFLRWMVEVQNRADGLWEGLAAEERGVKAEAAREAAAAAAPQERRRLRAPREAREGARREGEAGGR